ncbi:ferredoxin reductase family protein [bacterium]|nr:ferredoxin reductase family protein [bacterium]
MENNENVQTIWSALARITLYIAIVVAPLVLAAVIRPQASDSFVHELGKNFALLAFSILSMQFVVGARLKWAERPFGLDMIFLFHKVMGVFAATLLLLHPILLAASGKWSLLLDNTWYILAAKIILIFMLIHFIFVSLFRLTIRLEYEKWRLTHNIMAALSLLIGFLHSWYVGSDLLIAPAKTPMRILWIGLLGIAAIAYIYHRWHRRHKYRVIEVLNETHDVWTIKLAPPEGEKRYDYLPGQFHFITPYRESGLPVEEHPFTMSSSPTEDGFVSSTIKESGDFTSTIGKTKPGDSVAIQGPYGRFSYVLHSEERELVFIAGGVGITPLMSMLRHMRDTQSDKNVLLLYGSNTRDDIVFRSELSEIESGEHPHLKVVHVLAKPGDDWSGETGFVDGEKIERYCSGGLGAKGFYICGPPVMMNIMIQTLRELGVSDDHIHYERFAL